jgi:hypothetical protein
MDWTLLAIVWLALFAIVVAFFYNASERRYFSEQDEAEDLDEQAEWLINRREVK